MQNKELPLILRVTDTVKDISQSDWDRLFGTSCIESRDYHITLEESNLREFRLQYLLAKRGQQLVAIAPFFTNDFSFTTIIQGKLQKLILKLQKKISRFGKMKLLFVGFPTTEELYLGLSSEENIKDLMDVILKELSLIAKKSKVRSILFFNLTLQQNALAEYLREKDFVPMENFPNTRLRINANSLEEYMRTLSKNMRKGLKRKLRRSQEEVELKTEVIEELNGMGDEIYRLYLNNFKNSDVCFETLTPEFFHNICRNMPGKAKFLITRNRDKIVAFNLCLTQGETCIDKFIGFDDSVSRNYHLYYATFCHNVEWCIKMGFRNYQMGITDYHPKLRLGAKLIPLYIYAKSFNPIVNSMMKLLARFIEPRNFDPTLKNLSQKLTQNETGVVPSKSRSAV